MVQVIPQFIHSKINNKRICNSFYNKHNLQKIFEAITQDSIFEPLTFNLFITCSSSNYIMMMPNLICEMNLRNFRSRDSQIHSFENQ